MVRLGEKPWERDTSFIVDGSTNAKKLTIGEAYITPGNWAGFPPHKHDVDNMPSEGILEEIYYFLFDPQQGFGVQCLYTSDGEIDEAYRVKNDELVEFPRGYHTTVGAPGYNTYFLWLMAGEHQGFYRSNDPDHAWVAAVENLLKNVDLPCKSGRDRDSRRRVAALQEAAGQPGDNCDLKADVSCVRACSPLLSSDPA